MYRIIGGDGREYGPVTGDTIRQWIVQNRANAKTLVRADTSADWRPLGEIPEFAGSFGAPPPQPAEPSPPHQQPAAQPASAGPVDPKALTAAYVGRETDFSIGDCIGGAFRLLGINYWQAVGVTLLVTICMVVIQVVPIVGILATLLLTQVFNGGLFFYFVKMSRREVTQVADGFSGFSLAFGQLVLLSLVFLLLVGAVLLPAAVPAFGMAIWKWSPWVMVPLCIALALPAIYLVIAWTFAPILVIDRGLEFWDAMELSRKVVTRHWWSVFFAVIIGGFLSGLGILALIVGVVFTLPIKFATIAVAYEMLFPRE